MCARWQLIPKQAPGDTKYGTIPNIVGLEQMDIALICPRLTSVTGRNSILPIDFNTMRNTISMFVRRPDLTFICPS